MYSYADPKKEKKKTTSKHNFPKACSIKINASELSSQGKYSYRNRINFQWGFIFVFFVVDQNPRK